MRHRLMISVVSVAGLASLLGVVPAARAGQGSVGYAHLTWQGGGDGVCYDYAFAGTLQAGGGYFVGSFRLGRICAPNSGECGPFAWCTSSMGILQGTNSIGRTVRASCYRPKGNPAPLTSTAHVFEGLKCHGRVSSGRTADFVIAPYLVGNLFGFVTGIGDPSISRATGIYIAS